MIAIGVDLQNDFMNEKIGKLAVPGSEAIKLNVVRLLEFIRRNRVPLWLTADWHRETDPEISDTPDYKTTFPSHCVADTWGSQFIHEIAGNSENTWTAFRKDKFSVWDGNIDFHPSFVHASIGNSDFIVFGVAGDVCVKALLVGMVNARTKITVQVVSDCIASLSNEQFEQDIKELRVLFQARGHKLFVVNHNDIML